MNCLSPETFSQFPQMSIPESANARRFEACGYRTVVPR
jgi:hypothetical protein